MKKRLIVSIFCCFVTLAFSPAGYAAEPQVVVSASGKVSIKPDMAEFGVVVKSDAKAADKAAAETAVRYRAVQSALRTAGIPVEDAPTSAYTVSPRWEWSSTLEKNMLKGYTALHTIKVKVRALATTGRAIDAVVQAGADEVQSISFLSSRYEEFRQQALAEAVGNARRDAVIMAKAAGGTLGELIEVSLSQPFYGGRPAFEAMALRAAPAQAPTEIAPAEQEITVMVNSTWRFIGSPVAR
ncbi:MAG: SIMPL domain-containing protein [Chlorobium sp.]